MMRVLFDTNVLLDALLSRDPFAADAAYLFRAIENGKLKGFVSATTMTDVYYVVKRQTKSSGTAQLAIARLLALMGICAVDRSVLEQAIALGLSDFEDAVQVGCAISQGLDAIVTRDLDGFVRSPILILLPHTLKDQLIASGS